MAGELRFDPLTREWVNVVGARQHRPNLPTTGCPFCPGGLEAPEPYDTRWFPNRWPAYESGAPIDLAAAEAAGVEVLPAVGRAEVILYSPVHDGSLGSLGVGQIRKVVDLWAERTAALLAVDEVAYVLAFESRGTEVGATIHHPHGQIYAFPFIPPSPLREARVSAEHGCGVCAELGHEHDDERRIVARNDEWTAWVPFASGYPYGLRLAPTRHVGGLADLDDVEREALAAVLFDVLGRYDRLWSGDERRSEIFPYLMWFHQAPAASHCGRLDDYHLHVHLAPPQRAPGLARFIASGEVGSGTLSNPVVPEDAAETLRQA